MKKMTITTDSTIEAKGKLTNGNCERTVCLDNGDVFRSIIDTADILNLNRSYLWMHLQGKRSHCKKMHFAYLKQVKANPDILIKRIQEMAKEIAILKEKADKWDAMIAEQEAARKAEEKRAEDLAKAEEKHQRQQEMYERAVAKAKELLAAMAETENVIENLKGKEEVA